MWKDTPQGGGWLRVSSQPGNWRCQGGGHGGNIHTTEIDKHTQPGFFRTLTDTPLPLSPEGDVWSCHTQDFWKEACFTFSWCAVGRSGDAEKHRDAFLPGNGTQLQCCYGNRAQAVGEESWLGWDVKRGMGTHMQIQATPVTTLQLSDP